MLNGRKWVVAAARVDQITTLSDRRVNDRSCCNLPFASRKAAGQLPPHFETFRLASLVPVSGRSLVRSQTGRLNARKGR
jgi:hypothetical protein